jgi:hypothetical protein
MTAISRMRRGQARRSATFLVFLDTQLVDRVARTARDLTPPAPPPRTACRTLRRPPSPATSGQRLQRPQARSCVSRRGSGLKQGATSVGHGAARIRSPGRWDRRRYGCPYARWWPCSSPDRCRRRNDSWASSSRTRAADWPPDNRAYNAILRSMRCLGERGFAILTGRWRTLHHTTISPRKLGDIVRAALHLTHFGYRYVSSRQ